MELSENIAEISLEPQAHKEVKHITLHFLQSIQMQTLRHILL